MAGTLSAPFRRCRCKRPEALTASVFQWPSGTVVRWYYYQETTPKGLTRADVEYAIKAVAYAWSQACGIVFDRASAPEDAQVLVYFGSIDGQWNILGETELPVEGVANVHHRMELDASEQWDPVFLFGVVLHEMGHAIGIEHAPTSVLAVMDAIYNAGLPLQAWDKGQGVQRYGESAIVTPAAPTWTAESQWLKPFSFDFHIDAPGDYRITGQVDTLSGAVVNASLDFKKG